MSMSTAEYESVPKKPRIDELESHWQSSHTSTSTVCSRQEEEAALEKAMEVGLICVIRRICLRSLTLCRKLSQKLYLSVVDAVVSLAYSLFDKEDLYVVHLFDMVDDQMNQFWEQLEPFARKKASVNEVCKWIVTTKIDRDRYSLLNELNVASMLMEYKSCSYVKPLVHEQPEGLIDDKSAFDDDIMAAIKKAKQEQLVQRLTVEECTCLLLEMRRVHSGGEFQESLLARAMERIDTKALRGLEVDAISDLVGPKICSCAYEELKLLIKLDMMDLLNTKKLGVTGCSVLPVVYSMLLIERGFNRFDRSAASPFPDGIEFIGIAEIRRKAEGGRFISREHLLWAFEETGCGLRSAFRDELALRMVTDEDHPPYDVYDTMLSLASAEGEFPDVRHLAFAVIFDNYGFHVEKDEEVKELQKHFNRFKTAITCCVSEPKDQCMVWDGVGVSDYDDAYY